MSRMTCDNMRDLIEAAEFRNEGVGPYMISVMLAELVQELQEIKDILKRTQGYYNEAIR